MDRFFYAAVLSALLLLAPARGAADVSPGAAHARPVFFSMLFPQLAPKEWTPPFFAPPIEECTAGEAVCLEI